MLWQCAMTFSKGCNYSIVVSGLVSIHHMAPIATKWCPGYHTHKQLTVTPQVCKMNIITKNYYCGSMIFSLPTVYS